MSVHQAATACALGAQGSRLSSVLSWKSKQTQMMLRRHCCTKFNSRTAEGPVTPRSRQTTGLFLKKIWNPFSSESRVMFCQKTQTERVTKEEIVKNQFFHSPDFLYCTFARGSVKVGSSAGLQTDHSADWLFK